MKVMIRAAENRDVEAMAALDRLCFDLPWSKAAFEDEIVKNDMAFYIVAEMDDKVIGYAGLWGIVDEGHITNVAVHPDHRRKGIGEKLLRRLIEVTEMYGLCSFTLEVRPSNHSAISLYKKFGFYPVGRRERYYENNGEDALILWRQE